MYPLCSVDGVISDGASDPLLSIGDRMWLYGDGTFDTLRWNERGPHLWDRHIARLLEGVRRLGLYPPSALLVEEWCRELVFATGVKECVVRVTVVPQEGGGLVPLAPAFSYVVITLRSVPTAEQTATPLVAALSALPFQPPRTGVRIKSNDYRHVTMEARRLALSLQAHEVNTLLYADSEGRLMEGGTSNLVAVIHGELVTPPLSSGVLAGVTRGWLLDAAREQGLPVREERIPPPETLALLGGRLYATNAVAGIQPVARCGEVAFECDPAGDLLRELRERFWEA